MTARQFTLATMLAGTALVAMPMWSGHAPHLIWNASASIPIGLYRVLQTETPQVGDLVTVMPPDDLAGFLDRRGYLPRGVPMIKRVLALPGTEICRIGTTVIAYDHAYGEARLRDRAGRDLPQWQGCRVLAESEVFLMNWDAADSFDGRYFGPLPATSITARVAPIWIYETGDGRFEWRASMR